MSDPEMREPTFFVLAALAGGRRHGYALITETDRLSKGRVRLKVGTLYAALDRLKQHGLVRGAGEEAVDGRLRRYYELTDTGASTLASEAARMQANAQEAFALLRARPARMAPAL